MKIKYFIMLLVGLFFSHNIVLAAQPVVYDNVILDSDYDGLTDEGEKQIYKTDPNKSDTDGDSFFDGVEILAETNPLEADLQSGITDNVLSEKYEDKESDIPYPWYISRASGLISFYLLYLSIFFGLILRMDFFKKIFSSAFSFKAHSLFSINALLFALLHGIILIFDKTFKFDIASVFLLSRSPYEKEFVNLGIISMYLMIILIATSYLRKFISYKIWRSIHFLNVALYIIAIMHALNLGTDLKNEIFFEFFIWSNALLAIIFLWNIEIKIANSIRKRKSL